MTVRVAMVHSYYSSNQPSGENLVVDAQSSALRKAGWDVEVFGVRTDEVRDRPAHALRTALGVVGGGGFDPTAPLRAFRPDIVHVHNLFPNIGTRWLGRWSKPLVATLHNYRPLCANGLLFRDGGNCTQCPDGDRLGGIRHACYRGSRLATLPLTIRNLGGPCQDAVLRRADTMVCLSRRAREIYERFGAPPERLVTIPNFVERIHSDAAPPPQEPRWVAIGRLSAEKGFVELARNWPGNVQLDIIGDGPQRHEVNAAAAASVHTLGLRTPSEVRRILPTYSGLIIPSRCSEALPTVALEALEAGLPIVATEGNSASDLVQDSRVGLTLDLDATRPQIAEALAHIYRGSNELRARARSVFEEIASEQAWLRAIGRVYAQAAAKTASASA